jgi:hypothetical protein
MVPLSMQPSFNNGRFKCLVTSCLSSSCLRTPVRGWPWFCFASNVTHQGGMNTPVGRMHEAHQQWLLILARSPSDCAAPSLPRRLNGRALTWMRNATCGLGCWACGRWVHPQRACRRGRRRCERSTRTSSADAGYGWLDGAGTGWQRERAR